MEPPALFVTQLTNSDTPLESYQYQYPAEIREGLIPPTAEGNDVYANYHMSSNNSWGVVPHTTNMEVHNNDVTMNNTILGGIHHINPNETPVNMSSLCSDQFSHNNSCEFAQISPTKILSFGSLAPISFGTSTSFPCGQAPALTAQPILPEVNSFSLPNFDGDMCMVDHFDQPFPMTAPDYLNDEYDDSSERSRSTRIKQESEDYFDMDDSACKDMAAFPNSNGQLQPSLSFGDSLMPMLPYPPKQDDTLTEHQVFPTSRPQEEPPVIHAGLCTPAAMIPPHVGTLSSNNTTPIVQPQKAFQEENTNLNPCSLPYPFQAIPAYPVTPVSNTPVSAEPPTIPAFQASSSASTPSNSVATNPCANTNPPVSPLSFQTASGLDLLSRDRNSLTQTVPSYRPKRTTGQRRRGRPKKNKTEESKPAPNPPPIGQRRKDMMIYMRSAKGRASKRVSRGSGKVIKQEHKPLVENFTVNVKQSTNSHVPIVHTVPAVAAVPALSPVNLKSSPHKPIVPGERLATSPNDISAMLASNPYPAQFLPVLPTLLYPSDLPVLATPVCPAMDGILPGSPVSPSVATVSTSTPPAGLVNVSLPLISPSLVGQGRVIPINNITSIIQNPNKKHLLETIEKKNVKVRSKRTPGSSSSKSASKTRSKRGRKTKKKKYQRKKSSTPVLDEGETLQLENGCVLKPLGTPQTVLHKSKQFACLKTHSLIDVNGRSINNSGNFICQWVASDDESGQPCGKPFRQKCHWARHCKEKHVAVPTRHVCEQCGKHYAQRASLSHHISYHHARNSFRCSVPNCDKSFARKKTLQVHMSKSHGDVSIDPMDVDEPDHEATP